MTKQQKQELIKRAFQDGRIKRITENAFAVPSEFFILGITPVLISETLNTEEQKCLRKTESDKHGSKSLL